MLPPANNYFNRPAPSHSLAVLRRSRSPRPLNSSERSERNPKLWRSHIHTQSFTCFASAFHCMLGGFAGPLRGASRARSVQAIACLMNRGLRSFHSLTPVCKLSPLFPALCERGRICRASRGEEDGIKGHKRQRDSHAVLCTRRTSAHAGGAQRCARATQRARLCDSWKIYMQSFTCFADALAFRGRSLVLRKARRIS